MEQTVGNKDTRLLMKIHQLQFLTATNSYIKKFAWNLYDKNQQVM